MDEKPKLRFPGGEVIPLPDRLYKFLESHWSEQMQTKGSVRVGTLYEYRDQEKHSHGVLDTGEGNIALVERISRATREQLSWNTRMNFNFAGPGPITFEGTEITIKTSVPDMPIYCLSLSDSWSANIDPKYTECVEVHDVHGFVCALIDEFQKRTGRRHGVGVGPIVYKDREHVTRNDEGMLTPEPSVHPAFLKPASYASQCEYRFAFSDVSPVQVTCAEIPAIVDCIRFHSSRPS